MLSAPLELPMALHVAYGPRGVKKLCASLSDGSEGLASNLLTLNGLLSNQETKMEALQNDGVVVTVLTNLLASTEAEVRRQAALAISSLTLVYQGRIAAADALTVAALCGPLREDRDDEVRAACASALESLTSSRDGCSVVMEADAIVSKLTMALDDAHAPVLPPTIAALANMLRLDLGVEEALGAGVVRESASRTRPSALSTPPFSAPRATLRFTGRRELFSRSRGSSAAYAGGEAGEAGRPFAA